MAIDIIDKQRFIPMARNLFFQLEELGCRGRIVSIQHLRDLQEEIETQHREGLFDEDFYQERLTVFDFSPPATLSGANSLIVVAVPQPRIQVVFTWNGTPVPLVVPPTYLHWRDTDKKVKDLLTELLATERYRVALATLPNKLLAVHSGLGMYGKNNICYVPGMGSFHRLVALYSDIPCQEDNWQEPLMMEACDSCSACLHACPTGAITSERFLLKAERCITFHNEKPGDVPFPGWIDPSWHNCLVGCLRCQRACRLNRDFLERIEAGTEFSLEETHLLLQGVAVEQLPPATARKLEQSDLVDLLDVLPRNLSVLLRRESAVEV